MTHRHATTDVERRPLSATELGILDLLLEQDFQGAGQLRAQLPHAQVVGRCSCGCATVDLEVDRSLCNPALGRGAPILSEATVLDDGGATRGGVIVFLRDGYLNLLEIYSYFEPIAEWPTAAHLQLIVRDE
jgi:hypothetical protein